MRAPFIRNTETDQRNRFKYCIKKGNNKVCCSVFGYRATILQCSWCWNRQSTTRFNIKPSLENETI